MPWIQLTLEVEQSRHEQAEQAMLDAGALSVTLKDAEDKPVLEPAPGETPLWDNIILTGLFEAGIDTDKLQQDISAELDISQLKIEALEDKDWVRAWMDDYKPMSFGKRLWVCPSHMPPPDPDAVNLMLDPGLAFGTGTHPTTALCLQWLDSQPLEHKRVLDFGCGSGVLAIAAKLLGAEHCDAVDIDPQALIATETNARENQVANQLSTMFPEQLAQTKPRPHYAIVIANILAGPLIELAPLLADYTEDNGHIVLSGILETQAQSIIDRYSQWFALEPPVVQDEWVRISGRKKA